MRKTKRDYTLLFSFCCKGNIPSTSKNLTIPMVHKFEPFINIDSKPVPKKKKKSPNNTHVRSI